TLSILFYCISITFFFFFSSRRRHTRSKRDWSSDVCSSDLIAPEPAHAQAPMQPKGTIPDKPYKTGHMTFFTGPAAVLGEQSYKRSEERRVGKECRSRRVAKD